MEYPVFIGVLFFIMCICFCLEGIFTIIGLVIGAFFLLYGLACWLPHILMNMILESALSSKIEIFNHQPVIIPIIFIILVAIWSTPVLVAPFFNTATKKILGILFGIFPIVVILTFIHGTSEENYVKETFNKKYDNLATANMYFKNSKIGQELKKAIDTNDYEKINKYFPKGSPNTGNKNVKALEADVVIDKQALVNGINVPIITERFRWITEDKYVTIAEYEAFKEYTLDHLRNNDYKLSSDRLRFLYRLWHQLKNRLSGFFLNLKSIKAYLIQLMILF